MNVTNTPPTAQTGNSAQMPVTDAAQLMVLKKAINLQAANTATLLDALPQAPSVAMSGSSGHTINTTA
jgi:Putative motility protein